MVSFVYSILLGVGGIIGFLKGSTASLIFSSLFSSVLIWASHKSSRDRSEKDKRQGRITIIVVLSILGLFMG